MSSGQIIVKNLQCSLSVVGSCNALSADIMLETQIISNEVMRISFPFQVIHQQNSLVSMNISQLFQTKMINQSFIIQSIIASNKLTPFGQNLFYFSLLGNLSTSVWYHLILNFPSSQNPQSDLSFLGIATVSSNNSNAIVYDQNTFSIIDYAGVNVLSTLQLNLLPITFNQTLNFQPSSQNSYKIQVSPPSLVNSNYFIITLESNYYSFSTIPLSTSSRILQTSATNTTNTTITMNTTNTTIITNTTNTTNTTITIPSIPLSTMCFVDYVGCQCLAMDNDQNLNANQLQLVCTYNTPIRPQLINLTVNIVNSAHIINYPLTTTTSLQVYAIDSFNNIAFDSAFVTSVLPVYALGLNNYSLSLMWGVQYDPTLVYDFPLGLYASSSLTAVGNPVNNVKINFTINGTAPNNSYTIQVSLGEAQILLSGSIAHNFPNVPGLTLYCSFSYSTGLLTCKNLGALQALTNYFIAFKIYFSPQASKTQYFGKVVLLSNDNKGLSYTIAIANGFPSIPLYYSDEYIDTTPTTGFQQIPNFGYNFIASGSTSGTFGTAFQTAYQNGGTVGINTPSQPSTKQRLMFYLKASANQICPTLYPYCATGQKPEIYMKLIYNNGAITVDSPSSGIEHNFGCTSSSPASCSNFNSNSATLNNSILNATNSTTNQYLYGLLKCTGSYTTCSAMLPGSTIGFGLQNALLGKGSTTFFTSIYPSQKTLDFIVAFYSGAIGSLPSNSLLSSFMIINAYNIYSSQGSNLQAGIINYYTQGTSVNQGLTMPLMLRLSAQFSSTELGNSANAQHLAIFVDGMVNKFFAASSYQNPQKRINDGCSDGTSCLWYDSNSVPLVYPDNWTGQRFLLFNSLIGNKTTQQFQILAPFLSTLTAGQSLHIGILSSNSLTNSFDVINLIRVFGGALNQANMAVSQSYWNSLVSFQAATLKWDSMSNWNSLKPLPNNVVPAYGILNPATVLFPSLVLNPIIFLAAHTDSANLIQVNTKIKFGSGFTISLPNYYNDLFATSTVSQWVGAANQACQFLKYHVGSLQNRIIFCPYDSVSYTDGAANVGVQVSNFMTPFYWGQSYNLSGIFQYGWSTNDGMLAATSTQNVTTGSKSNALLCAGSVWTPIIILNSKSQRVQFTTSLTNSITLQNNDQFTLALNLQSIPQWLQLVNQCYISQATYLDINTLSCQIQQLNSTFYVTFTNNQNSTIIILQGIAYVVEIYVSHYGAVAIALHYSMQVIWGGYQSLNIIDQCTGPWNINFGTVALLNYPLQNVTLIFSNPNALSRGLLSIIFALNQRNFIKNSAIMIKMGYLQSINIDTLQQGIFECNVYEKLLNSSSPQNIWLQSYFFDSIYYDTNNQALMLRPKSQKINLLELTASNISMLYSLNCTGFQNSDGTSKTSLLVQWVDLNTNNNYSVIQSYSVLSPVVLLPSVTDQLLSPTYQLQSIQFKIILFDKKFNSPLGDSQFIFNIYPPNFALNHLSRIFVEFPVTYSPRLSNNEQNLQCLINNDEVMCQIDQYILRRVIINPTTTTNISLPQNTWFTLQINGVVSPPVLSQYGQIWVGLDQDNITNQYSSDIQTNLNGIDWQSMLNDIPFTVGNSQLLQNQGLQFSSYLTKLTNITLSMNITVPLKTIQITNILWIKVPPQMIGGVKKYSFDQMSCTLTRPTDLAKQNFANDCSFVDNLIQITLNQDDNNQKYSSQYQIQISPIRSSDIDEQVGQNKNFPQSIDVLFTDQLYQNIILKTTNQAVFTQSTFEFKADQSKIQLFWYTYDYQTQNYTLLGLAGGSQQQQYFMIRQGLVGNQGLFLGMSNPQARFQMNFNFTLEDVFYQDFIIFGSSKLTLESSSYTNADVKYPIYDFTSLDQTATLSSPNQDQIFVISVGDSGYWLRFTAKSTIASSRYILKSTYTTSAPRKFSWGLSVTNNSYFSDIPLLYVQVQEMPCQLTAQQQNYSLPMGGRTLPIVIDFNNCLPYDYLQITASFTDPSIFVQDEITQVVTNSTMQVEVLQGTVSFVQIDTSNKVSSRKQTNTIAAFQVHSSAIQQTQTSFTLYITLNGLNQNSFLPIIPITITTINSTQNYLNQPLPLTGNYTQQLVLTMQCPRPSNLLIIIGSNEISAQDYSQVQQNSINFTFNNNINVFNGLQPSPQLIQSKAILLATNSVNDTINLNDVENDLIQTFYCNELVKNVIRNRTATELQNQQQISLSLNSLNFNDPKQQSLINLLKQIEISKVELIPAPSDVALRRIYLKKSLSQVNQTYTLNLKNFQLSSTYSLGYYCVDQYDEASNFSSNIFTPLMNQTQTKNGLILTIGFTAEPTDLQKNNIICSISEVLGMNYYQVLLDDCNQCQIGTLNYTKKIQSDINLLKSQVVSGSALTPAIIQRQQELFYTFTVYLNAYQQSSLIDNDPQGIINNYLSLQNATMDSLVAQMFNQTDDPEIPFLFSNYSLSAQNYTTRTHEQLTTQMTLVGMNSTSDLSFSVSFYSRLQLNAFVGLQLLQPIDLATNSLTNPSGFSLRRGLSGNMNPLGVQQFSMMANQSTIITFYNLTLNQSYVLYWSSVPLEAHCLTQQYQDTGKFTFTFNVTQQNWSLLIISQIMVLLVILI